MLERMVAIGAQPSGNKARLAAQSRSHLDERFRELGTARRYASPVRGWIDQGHPRDVYRLS